MEISVIAKILVKVGAILGVIFGFNITFWLSYTLLVRWLQPIPTINYFDTILLLLSVVSIILAYLIYTRYLPRIDTQPFETAITIILFGFVITFGTWLIGGILLLIGGFVLLVDEIA